MNWVNVFNELSLYVKYNFDLDGYIKIKKFIPFVKYILRL